MRLFVPEYYEYHIEQLPPLYAFTEEDCLVVNLLVVGRTTLPWSCPSADKVVISVIIVL